MVVVDPYADYKPIKEASYMNIPVIALCDTHNNLKFVDVAIPCNNNSTESIAMVFWLLAREIKVLKGELDPSDDDWSEVMVDLFYHKNVDDLMKKPEDDEDLDEEDDNEDDQDEDEDEDEEEDEEENEDDWQNDNN